MDGRNIIELLVYAIIAIFGVLARELKLKDVTQLIIAKLISNMIVASFGAMIVYFIAGMVDLPTQTGYILAGLVGWGGTEVIDRLFEKHTDTKLVQEKE